MANLLFLVAKGIFLVFLSY